MTFLNKSHGELSKVEKPVLVPMSYERSNDNEEVKTVLAHNKNNNFHYNVVSHSENADKVKEILFEGEVEDKIKVTPKTILNPEVLQAMKNLQALYNVNAKKYGASP